MHSKFFENLNRKQQTGTLFQKYRKEIHDVILMHHLFKRTIVIESFKSPSSFIFIPHCGFSTELEEILKTHRKFNFSMFDKNFHVRRERNVDDAVLAYEASNNKIHKRRSCLYILIPKPRSHTTRRKIFIKCGGVGFLSITVARLNHLDWNLS